MLEENFDKNKIIEHLFDPDVSKILAELEDREKDSLYLEKKCEFSEDEIKQHLSYLISHNFVKTKIENKKIIYSVEKNKISEIIENSENFDAAIDGLTKMDSYLN